MRSLRVLISGVIGGAVGGLTTYLLSLAASGMGITFIPGLLLYTSSLGNLMKYFIVVIIAFVVGFLAVRSQAKKIREEIA